MITIDQSTKDLGNIPNGVLTSTIFRVTNNSTQAVVATDIKSSCGCTVPVFSKNPIGAMETVDFTLNFTPNQLNENIKSGSFTVEGITYTVYIKSNVL